MKRYQNNIQNHLLKLNFLRRLVNLTKYFIKNSKIPHFVIVFCETILIFSGFYQFFKSLSVNINFSFLLFTIFLKVILNFNILKGAHILDYKYHYFLYYNDFKQYNFRSLEIIFLSEFFL